MNTNNQTITGSVNYGAPIITPVDLFIALTATWPGEPVYNLNTTKLCTTI